MVWRLTFSVYSSVSRCRRAALSSIGTAVGWILFLAFLLDWLPFLGGLGFMVFLTAQFLFPVGLLVPAVVALGFMLLSQGLSSLAVRRFLPT